MAASKRALGVYVHWPYCARICPYCDFNVYKARPVDAARWTRAFARALEHWAARAPQQRLESIYFGGGTPSLAPPALVARIVETCRALWSPTDDLEVTLEANPTDAEAARFDAFRDAGVNRLSLGVQSFDDEALRFLKRNHDAAAARRAVATARAAFDRVNVDLIYALPGQTDDAWRGALSNAIAMGPDHLSLYQLTVEPGTAFERAVRRGLWTPADEDRAADLFDLTQTLTDAAGLPAYEISNHARPGFEARHNRLYWRGADYIGVGPGAHGRLTGDGRRIATYAEPDPARWIERVEREGAASAETMLTAEEAFIERIAMGLRTTEGVALTSDERARIAPRAAPLIGDGLLHNVDGRLAATRRGRAVLNAVLADLIAG